ncbi:telomere repeat-binding protein 3 isoform X3 [Populus trichocarpa]|uniref:telomere repeat-binding protein 3 isoform X3 n=1 Tax=Populus trichocarpa TaxID=3694 RepID=UPI00227920F6|nr:telomere repeat-binding protein 3 isoform X3 [Populus trichocarpa]
MVVKKRQYYGFNGFHMPPVPRAPRSARQRGLSLNKKKVEDSQLCAFDLLASLAGKLLQESESSASSNASEANDQPIIGGGGVKCEQAEERPLKAECLDHGSCGESAFVTGFTSPNSDQKCLLNAFPHAESCSILERSSMISNSNSSEKVGADLKTVICKSKSVCENFTGKVEGSFDSRVSCDGYVDNGFRRQQGGDGLDTGGLTAENACSLKDPMEMCMKFPALIKPDNDVELPSRREPVPNASIPRRRNDTKLGVRDDDLNFSRCKKLLTKPKAFRPPQRIGDRRIRKLLTSKYWKVAPKLKECELSKPAFFEGGMKPHYRKRKLCYSRERYQHDTFYKRKCTDRSVVMTSDGGFSSESVCNSPDKSLTGDKNGTAVMLHGANGVSSSVIGHQSPFHSKDSHVKLSIKSFRVPELFIEIPETATVGSLKRTVLEAVSAVLGSGLRVGVLLHGMKVRDDNRTLLQTGMTSKENLDTLGFSLEPIPVQAPPPLCTEDPALLPCDTSQLISRALVAVPPINAEALAMVPLNPKSKRSELVQRRTRRPFSVSEVEALVHAVEEVGTGRWRDVKLRSFEDADHRTYVDLKDKWKTLVHTARIAPQQRRGEPVPQELLDRVLAAHAYWSQHQAKQHSKNQAAILKITVAHAVRNGVEDNHSI